MLKVNNLRYTDGGGRKLLGPLSFDLPAHQRLIVKGPSGSGKTTLCRILGGRLPSAIAVRFKGADYYGGTVDASSPVAVTAHYLHHQARDHFFGATLSELFIGNREQAQEALESVGLTPDLLARDPFTLSSGEAVRARLAQLMSDDRAGFMVLDSPWCHIDPSDREPLSEIFLAKVLEVGAVIESESAATVQGAAPTESVELTAAHKRFDYGPLLDSLGASDHLDDEDYLAPWSLSCDFAIGERNSRFHLMGTVPVRPGITWIYGKNGTGKSTLMRAGAGLPPHPLGKVVIIDHSSRAVDLARVGYIEPSLPFDEAQLEKAVFQLVGTHATLLRRLLATGAPGRRQRNNAFEGIMTAVLLNAALGKTLIFLDEPFQEVCQEEVAALVQLFRRTARRLKLRICIASHLSVLPREADEALWRLSLNESHGAGRLSGIEEVHRSGSR